MVVIHQWAAGFGCVWASVPVNPKPRPMRTNCLLYLPHLEQSETQGKRIIQSQSGGQRGRRGESVRRRQRETLMRALIQSCVWRSLYRGDQKVADHSTSLLCPQWPSQVSLMSTGSIRQLSVSFREQLLRSLPLRVTLTQCSPAQALTTLIYTIHTFYFIYASRL